MLAHLAPHSQEETGNVCFGLNTFDSNFGTFKVGVISYNNPLLPRKWDIALLFITTYIFVAFLFFNFLHS